MPLLMQVKLLRTIESGEVVRVGGTRPTLVDVRVIAATHRSLRDQIAAGNFREDLFLRLDGLTLMVPPLRERVNELIPLADQFLRAAADELGRSALTLGDSARAKLLGHGWPGNIRELRNVMKRAALIAPASIIEAESVLIESVERESVAQKGSSALPAAGSSALELERERIVHALEACLHNQTKAAQMLGISRRTLVKKITALDLPRPRK